MGAYGIFLIYRRNIIKINATQKQRNQCCVVLAIFEPHFGENDVMKGENNDLGSFSHSVLNRPR